MLLISINLQLWSYIHQIHSPSKDISNTWNQSSRYNIFEARTDWNVQICLICIILNNTCINWTVIQLISMCEENLENYFYRCAYNFPQQNEQSYCRFCLFIKTSLTYEQLLSSWIKTESTAFQRKLDGV